MLRNIDTLWHLPWEFLTLLPFRRLGQVHFSLLHPRKILQKNLTLHWMSLTPCSKKLIQTCEISHKSLAIINYWKELYVDTFSLLLAAFVSSFSSSLSDSLADEDEDDEDDDDVTTFLGSLFLVSASLSELLLSSEELDSDDALPGVFAFTSVLLTSGS